MKPALVTGATGFVGSHLATRLLALGRPVRLLVRDPGRLAPDLRARACTVTGDLADPASLFPAVDGVGEIFHCAANVRTWDRPEAYRQANAAGVGHLLDAIARLPEPPVRFVHFSSADVYGFPRQPAAEDMVSGPTGYGYGDSKQAGESLLREWGGALGLPWTILRPCNVMGPGSPFIERIGRELRGGLMLTVDGGRENCGYLDVHNLVDAALWAAEADAAVGGTFNVRDPVDISWNRFVQDLRQAVQGRGVVLDLPYRLAMGAAHLLSAPYRALGLRGEPLLHPLLVQIFGRTCGHPTGRLQAAGAPLGRVDYATSLALAASTWPPRRP